MRIEQAVDGVVQAVAPTTAEQRLAKKNELKARGTLLMALPDKHQLQFNTHKDAKSLMEAIVKSLPTEWRTHTLIWRNKTDLEDQSLDDLFNNLKIYKAEVKSLSSTSLTTQNIAFMSSQNTDSTNELDSAVASVSAASTKVLVFVLPNVDNLSDVVIYSFFANGHADHESKEVSSEDRKESRSQWNHFYKSFQEDKETTNYALMAFTSSSSTSSSGSNSEVAPYSKACSKAYATLQSHYDKLTNDLRKSHFDVLSYRTGLESVEARLVVYQQNENVFEEDIKLLKLDVMLRDNALVKLRKKFKKAEQERDEYTSYLSDFEEINGGYVAFGRNPKGGKITGKDTECIVLSSDFKLPDDNHVLLRIPRENNMYNVDLKNIVPSGDLTFLFAKATLDESNLWHRRLGHINFKTINKLVKGKFDRKADEGFLVGYSVSGKAFRVFNNRTRIVQETLHINFLENQPKVVGSGPTCLFDIDTLTQSMNYQLVIAGNQPNSSIGIQENLTIGTGGKEAEYVQQYVLLPLWSFGSKDPQNIDAAAFEVKEPESEVHVSPSSSDKTKKHDDKTKREAKGKSHVDLFTGVKNLSEEFEDFSSNSTNGVNATSTPITAVGPNSTNKTNSFSPSFEIDDEGDVGEEADFSNLETSITASPIPTTRVHKDHSITKIIGDLSSAPQMRSMTRMVKDQVARIEAIRLFLAYASFMGFMVYQMDVKSAFLYGTIEEEVYVYQPPGSKDPDYPDKVYKTVKALYGLHQAPKAWYETLANYLLENGFQRGKID
nr:putative ribonuclease H-like domain-containing protein [Tanacetum cinerariifolium]